MNPIVVFIILGVVMWVLNFIFGMIQIKDFNSNYIEMKKVGRVVIGRKKGFIQAGTVVMFLIDGEDRIVRSKKMQGITVLARIRGFKGLEGKRIDQITKSDLKCYNKLMRIAILDAIKNFNAFKGGEEKKVSVDKVVVN